MARITRYQIERVVSSIDSLHNMMFEREGIRAYPYQEACAMAGDDPDWEELTKGQQRAVMERYVDWAAFTPSDVDRTITNVLSGRPREEWFEGVEIRDEKGYREWVADEKNAIRAAVRRLNLMRDSQDPDCLGYQLSIQVAVKWEELSDEQKTKMIVFRADRGQRLFDESYGDIRRRLIDKELGRKADHAPESEAILPQPPADVPQEEWREFWEQYGCEVDEWRKADPVPDERPETEIAGDKQRIFDRELSREDIENRAPKGRDVAETSVEQHDYDLIMPASANQEIER